MKSLLETEVSKRPIRWKRRDYSKLSYAVRRFNRLITTIDDGTYRGLYKGRDYASLKSTIHTRSQFNKVIKELNSATIDNLENIIKLPSGEILSSWEYKVLKSNRRSAINKLNKELKMMISDNDKLTSKAIFDRTIEIQDTIKSLQGLEQGKKDVLDRLRTRILSIGSNDYYFRKAKTFQDNIKNNLKDLKGYRSYNKLKKYVNSFKNPVDFWNEIKGNAVLMDFFSWYKNNKNSRIYGYKSTDDALDEALVKQGILT